MSGLSLNVLPIGPLLNTFFFLLPSEEIRLRTVCKNWNTLILDDPRWKALGEKIQSNSFFPINVSSNQTCFSSIREFCILIRSHFGVKKDPPVVDKLDITFNAMAQIASQMHNYLEKAFITKNPDEISSVLEKMMLAKQKPNPHYLDSKLEQRIKNTEKSLLVLKWMPIFQEAPNFEQLFRALEYNHELVLPIFEAIQQCKPDTLTSLGEDQLAVIAIQQRLLIPLALKEMKSSGNVIDNEKLSLAISNYSENVFSMPYAKHRPMVIVSEEIRQYDSEFLPSLLALLKQQKINSCDLMLLQVMKSCPEHLEAILSTMQQANQSVHCYVFQKLSDHSSELMQKYADLKRP